MKVPLIGICSPNTVNLETLEVNQNTDGSPLYLIADGQGDQINVYPYTALNGRYMIAWEDSRNNSDENLQTHTDIYYQEIDNGEFVYSQSGIALCDAYEKKILPSLIKFNPELIMLSAGFDGHKDDPLCQLNLVVQDFNWVTKELTKVARQCCQSRLVSVLEGGYHLGALKDCVASHLSALLSDVD